jgi:hypothetical protein
LSPVARASLRAGLAVAFVGAGWFAFERAVLTAATAYSAMPSADTWSDLTDVEHALAGHVSLAHLRSRHNEHRMVLSRLQFSLASDVI